jgi:Tfp pilus assembly protein PilO
MNPGRFSSNQSKTVLIIISVVLVFGIMIYFGVFPLLDKVRGIQDKISENDQQLVDLAKLINGYKSVSIKFSKVEDYMAEVSAVFPLREDSAAIVESIENAVLKSGVTADLVIVDHSEDAPGNTAGSNTTSEKTAVVNRLAGLDEVPYNLHFSGNYSQIANLFQYLENMPFFTQLSELSVSAETFLPQNAKMGTHSGIGMGDIQGVLFVKKP